MDVIEIQVPAEPILFTSGSDFSDFGRFAIRGVQDGSAFLPSFGL